jgi:hypothetical protein
VIEIISYVLWVGHELGKWKIVVQKTVSNVYAKSRDVGVSEKKRLNL